MSRTEVTGRLGCRLCQLLAVVEAHVDAALGARVEQAAAHGIGAHDVHAPRPAGSRATARVQVRPPSRVR